MLSLNLVLYLEPSCQNIQLHFLGGMQKIGEKYDSGWRSGGKMKKNMISIAPLGYEFRLGYELGLGQMRKREK